MYIYLYIAYKYTYIHFIYVNPQTVTFTHLTSTHISKSVEKYPLAAFVCIFVSIYGVTVLNEQSFKISSANVTAVIIMAYYKSWLATENGALMRT